MPCFSIIRSQYRFSPNGYSFTIVPSRFCSGGGGTVQFSRSSVLILILKLDILLSDENGKVAKRDPVGIYMTGSWYEYHMQTLLNADKLIEEMGYEAAAVRLRSIFGSFNQFYIIDTGVFDIAAIQQGLASLVKILDGYLYQTLF